MREIHRNWRWEGFKLVSFFWITFAGIFPAFASEKLERFEFLQIRMGIPVRIVVYADSSATAIQASDAAYARIREIDRALSDYDPDSEAMQLCHNSPIGIPVKVGTDLLRVLSASKDLHARSEGAFDVTIGPVVELWRIARRKHQLPPPEKLRAALALMGDECVELNQHEQTVTIRKQNMQLDFGGIAKGYAADEALRVLREQGVSRALIAVAGDLRLGAPPPDAAGWKVEVEDKTVAPGPERVPLVLLLVNCAISTAGDAYQFVEVDGVRYSHILDPKTGLGMTTPGSVTVIAPTGMQADGLDSTMVILGPKKGLQLMENLPETYALIVRLAPDGQRSVVKSAGWPAPYQESPQKDLQHH